MEDEKKCRVGGMYEAIYLRGKALDYCFWGWYPVFSYSQLCTELNSHMGGGRFWELVPLSCGFQGKSKGKPLLLVTLPPFKMVGFVLVSLYNSLVFGVVMVM